MSHHQGYDKNHPKSGANASKGYSTKTVTSGDSDTLFSWQYDAPG